MRVVERSKKIAMLHCSTLVHVLLLVLVHLLDQARTQQLPELQCALERVQNVPRESERVPSGVIRAPIDGDEWAGQPKPRAQQFCKPSPLHVYTFFALLLLALAPPPSPFL